MAHGAIPGPLKANRRRVIASWAIRDTYRTGMMLSIILKSPSNHPCCFTRLDKSDSSGRAVCVAVGQVHALLDMSKQLLPSGRNRSHAETNPFRNNLRAERAKIILPDFLKVTVKVETGKLPPLVTFS